MDSTTAEITAEAISISEISLPGLKLTTNAINKSDEQYLAKFLIRKYDENLFHEINEARNKLLFDTMKKFPKDSTIEQLMYAVKDMQIQERDMMETKLPKILKAPVKDIPISLPHQFEYLLTKKQKALLKNSKLQCRYIKNSKGDEEKEFDLNSETDDSTTILNLGEGINIYINDKVLHIPPRSILFYSNNGKTLKVTIKSRKTYSFNKDQLNDGFIVKQKNYGYRTRTTQHMVIINKKPM